MTKQQELKALRKQNRKLANGLVKAVCELDRIPAWIRRIFGVKP